MKYLRPASAVILLSLVADPAAAHGMGGMFEPHFWSGLAVGAAMGAWTGLRGSHPGLGVAWAFVVTFLILFGWLAISEGISWGGILFVLFGLPVFSGLPLAIIFFVIYGACVVLKERWRQPRPIDEAETPKE